MTQRWLLSLCLLLIAAAAAPAQVYRYPYHYPQDYGFTLGQYPYYHSPYFQPVYRAGVVGYYPLPQYAGMFSQPGVAYDGQMFYPARVPIPSYSTLQPAGATHVLMTPPSAPADNSTTIDVRVPDPDAEVWVDDHKTTQKGLQRRYTTPPLAPGQTHTYDIKVEWVQNGKKVDQTQKVQVQAGQHVGVDFFPPSR